MDTLRETVIICCGLSIVGALFVSITYASFKQLRAHPTRIVAFISMCDLIFNVVLLLGTTIPNDALLDTPTCIVTAVLTQFFGVASAMWNMIMAANIILVLRNPFSYTANYYKWYHLNVWGWSFVSTVIMVVFNQWGRSNLGSMYAL